MTRSSSPLAYTIKARDPTGKDFRRAVHLQCAECGRVDKLPWVSQNNNPIGIEKMFIRIGWDCNVHKPAECICPKCVSQRRVRVAKSFKEAFAIDRPKEVPVTVVEIKPDTTPMIESRHHIGLKSLTADQKAALRNEFDSTFDDKTGRYIDGNNDHLISEKLDIPRAVVIEFRENFYGELKEDPEITAFSNQLEEAKKHISNLQSTINKLELKLDEMRKKVGL